MYWNTYTNVVKVNGKYAHLPNEWLQATSIKGEKLYHNYNLNQS